MTTAPQPGILNRPPQHAILVAYDFVGTRDRATCIETLELLRAVVRRELQSDIDQILDSTDKSLPFTETGELGFADGFNRNHLTITIGFGPGAFDALGVPPELRPADLIAPPFDQIGVPADNSSVGEIVLQINTNSTYVAEHVQRRVEVSLAGRLQTVWAVRGDQRFTSRDGHASGADARALIGFHDGTANLDPAHSEADAELVFVDPANMADYPSTPTGPQQPPQPGQPGYGTTTAGPIFPTDLQQPPSSEPAWTKHGTYMFVQAIDLKIAEWDTSPLATQENIIGRFKRSGASLDLDDLDTNRTANPAFVSNPADVRVDPTAHIRKSNPRSAPEDLKRRIFRRGYPLIIADGTGNTRRGLIFQSYSRSISTQIEFILRGWMFNPNFPAPGAGQDRLNHFMHTICGGYYFVPPLAKKHEPTSWVIPPNS